MSALAEDAIVIRAAVETDLGLIYSSWLRSYWNARPAALDGVAYADYQQGQRARIDRLLRTHGASVACSPAAPDTIMGWACFDPARDEMPWHYVYTRQTYRRMGVASLLLGPAQAGTAATHMTDAFHRCFPRVPFNPYLLEQT
jgi:GNAT superfamily N-acetyltransferase